MAPQCNTHQYNTYQYSTNQYNIHQYDANRYHQYNNNHTILASTMTHQCLNMHHRFLLTLGRSGVPFVWFSGPYVIFLWCVRD